VARAVERHRLCATGEPEGGGGLGGGSQVGESSNMRAYVTLESALAFC